MFAVGYFVVLFICCLYCCFGGLLWLIGVVGFGLIVLFFRFLVVLCISLLLVCWFSCCGVYLLFVCICCCLLAFIVSISIVCCLFRFGWCLCLVFA